MHGPSRYPVRWLFVLLAVSLLFSCGCAVFQPRCVTDGVSYCRVRGNFTGRWYDYYERALSCMEGGCYGAALTDLEEAIRRREADQRRARTVGMHFIDYFPHREKGLIHYLTGDYAAAKSELERSLAQYPSEKARYYLDQTRIRLLRQAGQRPANPRLSLTLPAEPTEGIVWVRQDPVRIAGTAVDEEQLITDILINKSPVFMEASARQVRFSEDLVLAEGRHDVEVRARNLLGGEARRWVRLRVDRSGPMIAVDRFVPGEMISGNLLDPAGIAAFRINGQPVYLSGEGVIPFKGLLHSRSVILTAVDRLGNETRYHLDEMKAAGAGRPQPSSRGWLAMSGRDGTAMDAGSVYGVPRAAEAPLTVEVKGFTDPQIVFAEILRLPVEVRSEAEVRHLSVNGKAVTIPFGGTISFTSPLRLAPGENQVTIVAADAEGRNVQKRLRVIRQIPEAFQLQHRYGLSVHPFDFTEQDPERIRVQHELIQGLLRPRRFRLSVSDDLRNLLERQGLEIGREASWTHPHSVLLGVIHETRNGIEAAARVVNVETRATLAVADVYAPHTNREALAAVGRRLSEKFLRQFPLVAAEITDISANRLRTAIADGMTGEKSLPPEWPLLVYRPTPSGGPALGTDARIIGGAVAVGEPAGKGFTAVVDPKTAGVIRPTDRVVAR